MANVLYDKYREAQLAQSSPVDWDADTIKAVFVDTTSVDPNKYTFAQAHQFLSDVPAGSRLATSAGLASKTDTSGVADAADIIVTGGIASGKTAGAILLYKDTGVAGTSPLIAYLDTGAGLPCPGNANDVQIVWDNTAGTNIFKL